MNKNDLGENAKTCFWCNMLLSFIRLDSGGTCFYLVLEMIEVGVETQSEREVWCCKYSWCK